MSDDTRNDAPATEKGEDQVASPTELAGTTEGAIAAEFAARDAIEAANDDSAPEDPKLEDTLPLDGE